MGHELTVGRTTTTIDVMDADYDARNDRWLTPLPIIRALGDFDLDPAGAPDHPTAREVWTPEEVGDGLSMPWRGRVWLNPPYGRAMPAWVRALALHDHGTLLVFATTETVMWHDWVWPYATAILFLKGRLTFMSPEGIAADANSGKASVLIAYGQEDAEALERSGLAGHLVWLKPTSIHSSKGTDHE